MNVKSIYETLTALGAGALIAGCGAQQTPVDTAEAPPVEITPASATKEASSAETGAPMATPAVASPEEKPNATAVAAPAPVQTTAPSPVAATAKPVQKKAATAATTTGKAGPKKKDGSSSCGEGGCG